MKVISQSCLSPVPPSPCSLAPPVDQSIFPQETFVARLLALMGRFDTDADCYLGQPEMTSLIQITRPLSLTASLKVGCRAHS